jgi:hypothetical protein
MGGVNGPFPVHFVTMRGVDLEQLAAPARSPVGDLSLRRPTSG